MLRWTLKEAWVDATRCRPIVSAHLKAEGLGDIEGTVAVYTTDIELRRWGFG